MGGGERVCGSADLAKNFVRITDFNNNFSGSADPINVMDSDLGKKIVLITDSRHNCSRIEDLDGRIDEFGTEIAWIGGSCTPFIPPV